MRGPTVLEGSGFKVAIHHFGLRINDPERDEE